MKSFCSINASLVGKVCSRFTYPGSCSLRNGFAEKHGYQTDPDTGLDLLGHRYYAPKLGRFLTQDPIGHEGGLNLYSYCDNNPLAKVDPDGKVPEWWLNLGTWVDDTFLGGGIAGAGDAWGRWESGTGSGWTVVTNFVWAGLNGASNFVSGGSSGAIRGAGSTIGRNIASRTTVKVASNYAVVKAGLKLIGKIKQHHLFPKEFARKFAELGIKINEHIVNVDQSLHKLLHEKGGGELWKQSWNRQWENFFRSNRNAGKDDAMKFMMQMRKKFGI